MPAASLKFPSPGLQALSAVVHFLGESRIRSVLALLLSSHPLLQEYPSYASVFLTDLCRER